MFDEGEHWFIHRVFSLRNSQWELHML
jgi:hypothetical protein